MVKFRGSREDRKKRPKTKDNVDYDDDEIESERTYVKKWYENIPKEPEVSETLPDSDVNRLKDEARMVLDNDAIHYRNKTSNGTNKSDNNWLQTMVTKGTFQDKLAASIVLVQNSPLYGLVTIRSLINQVKTSKKYCSKVMEVVTDLFISDLLIPNKKLRPFEKHPLSLLEKLSDGNSLKRKSFLSNWYFEDQLKNEYRNFIQAVRDVGQDTVDSNRIKSIIAMQKLLAAHPEQEALLLSNLVNKIGDRSASVASRAVQHLKKVLEEHPNMKTVVLNEIEKLLFRTNISQRAQYFGLCFLSQFLFKKDEEELANKLLQLYFAFFKGCIKKGEVDSRMMSILLAGVNRAFPFAKRDIVAITDHIDTLYRIVHIAQYGVSLQTLCLLFQVSDCDAAISDRFYSALYQHILHPNLSSSSQHAMFVSLVFRAMCKDIQFNRTKVFIKRLLQICHYVPVTLACGILIMLSHLFEKFPNLQSLTLIASKFLEDEEENEDNDEEHYVDVPLEEVKEENENKSNSENFPVENKIELSEKLSEDIKPVISSWFHIENVKDKPASQKTSLQDVARNPLFLAGKLNVYTELVSLSSHFHPTVSLFANHLLEGTKIEYTGDPLRDFTLTRFLDRWVFKNPKKLNKNSETKFSRKSLQTPNSVKNLPTNSEQYLNTAEGAIPPEELFMYRFLKKQREKGGKIKKEKDDNEDDDSDVSSVASDEFEGIMGQLMGGKEEIDYSEGIKPSSATGKKKEKKVESDDDDDDDDDYADSEDEIDGEADNSDFSENEEGSDLENDGISENEDGDDEDIDYEKLKEEFSDLDEIDDDEAAITFDDNDDDEDDFSFTMSDVEKDEFEHKQKKKNKKPIFEGKKLKKGIDSLFAPAEEFAEMLEDTGDQIAKYGNLATISNKDNAGMKQLKWEMSRNQWMHGHRDRRKRKGGFSTKPAKKFKKRK